MNVEEREWQAQEAAMRRGRSGSDGQKLDTLSASYLSIVHAARQPIDVQLPVDFASRIALLAGERPHTVVIESRFERRMLIALIGLLGVAGLAAAMFYGGNWLMPSIKQLGQIGKPSLSLLMSLIACLGLSAIWQPLRRFVPIISGRGF